MNPLVSVVIPTFNRPDLLALTLESVFAQSFENFEVVVIDDGSTDDTPQKLRELQARHGARLGVIRQKNGGIGAARNRGLDEARGRYIALLDHDDLWMPTKLSVQLEYLQAHPQCVACGTLFSLSDDPQKPHFTLESVAGSDGVVARPLWETIQGRDVLQTSTLMIDTSRTAGLRYGLTRGAIEDVEFHIGLLARGSYGIAGHDVLAIYRLFDANASKNPEFYFRGIMHLRALQKSGVFDTLPARQKTDADLWLGHIARITSAGELLAGRRGRGMQVYLRDLPHQLRTRRWKFVLGYPLAAAGPAALARRMFRQ